MVTTLIQRVKLNMLRGVQEITRPTNFLKDREQNWLEQWAGWLISKASRFLLKDPPKNLLTAIDNSSYCIIITCYFPFCINFMNGSAQ